VRLRLRHGRLVGAGHAGAGTPLEAHMTGLFLGLLAGGCHGDEPPAESLADTSSDSPADTSPPSDTSLPAVTAPAAITCPEVTGRTAALPTSWTATSSAPGGDVITFGVSGGTTYAGTEANGLYRLDAAWSPLNAPITHVEGQLAVHPDDPDLLAYGAKDLWLSEDGGQGWTNSAPAGEGTATVTGLAWMDEALFAIVGGSAYRSDDRGASFTALGEVNDEGAGGSTSDTEAWSLHTHGTTLFAMRQDGPLFRSADEGGTWQIVRSSGQEVGAFAVGDGVLYTADGDEVQASTDEGVTWASAGLVSGSITGLASRSDGALVVAAGGSLWTWDGSVFEATDLDDEVLTVAFAADGTLYAGLAEGIWRSDDAGRTGEDFSSGLVDVDLATLLAHPVCEDLLWVGSSCERGLFASTDWGATWSHESTHMHYVMVLAANPSRPEELWVTTDDVLYRSPDLGATWDTVQADDMHVHLHALAIDPFDPDRVVVGSAGSGDFADSQASVYLSEDGAETWERVHEGLPVSEASIQVLHFAQDHQGVVLAGSFRGGGIDHTGDVGFGLYRSTDGARTWSKANLEASDISQIEQCGTRTYAATDAGVAVSDDAGSSWSIALAPSDDEFLTVACRGDVVLAIDGQRAIWRSDDAGGSWYDWGGDALGVGKNLETQRTMDIVITADGAAAYLAFRELGVWIRAL